MNIYKGFFYRSLNGFQRYYMSTPVVPKKRVIFTRMRVSLGILACVSYIGYRQGKTRYNAMHFTQMYESLPDTEVLTQEYFGEHKVKQRTLFQRALIIIRRGIRFCHLAIKFLPLMLTLPIALLFRKLLYKRWLNLMIYTLENAGPLWIKLGQWASHRGDIFGEDITIALEKLRDAAPEHNAKYTHKQFEEEFHKSVYEVFEFFNEKPIASGSIAQVYKARLNGQNVAIKVRHPDIIQNLEIDIKILYTVANFLGRTILKQLAMPVTFDEFMRTLVNQTDLRFEAKNLVIFNEKFIKQPSILFPSPIEPYVSSSILVETFEEGIKLSDFMESKQKTQVHSTIANLGLKAFYKMLIFDNFIHADCHAGNIFIRVVPKNTNLDNMNYFQRFNLWLENGQDKIYEIVEQIIETSIEKYTEWYIRNTQNENQKNKTHNYQELSNEQKSDEKIYTKHMQTNQEEPVDVKIIFLDPGMVTILNKSDRASFIKLVMYVTLRKPIECGNLMLQLGNYNGKRQIDDKVKKLIIFGQMVKAKYLGEMEELFESVCAVPLSQMNIGFVLRQMLEILRKNGMSIEGHFAALLTNMIVLEGIGKTLDPSINIVAKAASFLLHFQTIDKTVDEIIQQAL